MDLNNLMKQFQQMQKQLMEAQEKQANKEYEGTAAGGKVSVVVVAIKIGAFKVQKVRIDPELVIADETEILEDLVMAAFNDAMKKIDEDNENNISNMASMMGLPPGFKLPM